jgi:tetratricopeptide (TPR) repeat protein
MTGRDEFGAIEVGKRADLVLVDRNPLEEIACVRKPRGVMAAGRWLPSDSLEALLKVKTQMAQDRLREAYGAGGIDAALGAYQAMKDGNLHNAYYYCSETLNQAAYELLGAGKVDEAIRLFELNAAEYPEDPNVYDSLAEGYMKRGDKQLAIQFYRKSLALNPENTNAVNMLKTLGSG